MYISPQDFKGEFKMGRSIHFTTVFGQKCWAEIILYAVHADIDNYDY